MEFTKNYSEIKNAVMERFGKSDEIFTACPLYWMAGYCPDLPLSIAVDIMEEIRYDLMEIYGIYDVSSEFDDVKEGFYEI